MGEIFLSDESRCRDLIFSMWYFTITKFVQIIMKIGPTHEAICFTLSYSEYIKQSCFVLILYVTVINFSVTSGWVFLG